MYCINKVVLRAPAKVNLSLDITGTAPDGYHTLKSVMLAVDLCDIVYIDRRNSGGIRVTCSRPGIPEDEGNIAYKAASVFFGHTGLAYDGLSIRIDKSIPHEAGLAGGSADAAAVILGLNRLFGAGLDNFELAEIGAEIGADVPFCMTGGCKLAKGKGELLHALPDMPAGHVFLIAKPAAGIGTAAAYRLYDEFNGNLNRPDTNGMVGAIKAGNLAAIGGHMLNVFEQIICLPEISAFRRIMTENGALGASMSGSGSAVAGLFGNRKQAYECMAEITKLTKEAVVACSARGGAEIISIS